MQMSQHIHLVCDTGQVHLQDEPSWTEIPLARSNAQALFDTSVALGSEAAKTTFPKCGKVHTCQLKEESDEFISNKEAFI
jgi:hypothetical protein